MSFCFYLAPGCCQWAIFTCWMIFSKVWHKATLGVNAEHWVTGVYRRQYQLTDGSRFWVISVWRCNRIMYWQVEVVGIVASIVSLARKEGSGTKSRCWCPGSVLLVPWSGWNKHVRPRKQLLKNVYIHAPWVSKSWSHCAGTWPCTACSKYYIRHSSCETLWAGGQEINSLVNNTIVLRHAILGW